jgi:hypothetical protein
MKIRYIDLDGPESTSTQGYSFNRGEWVEVTEEIAIRKLSRNPGFEALQDERTESSEIVRTVAPKKRGRPRLN